MKERSFGAVVVDEKGRYLLVKHRYGGHWDFPKGHMEGDESPLEAALREVLEETGLELELFGEHVLKYNLLRLRPELKRLLIFISAGE